MRIVNGNKGKEVEYWGGLSFRTAVKTEWSPGRNDWYVQNPMADILGRIHQRLLQEGFQVAYSIGSVSGGDLTILQGFRATTISAGFDYGIYTRKTGGHRWKEITIANSREPDGKGHFFASKGRFVGKPDQHQGIGFPKGEDTQYNAPADGTIPLEIVRALHKVGLESLVK